MSDLDAPTIPKTEESMSPGLPDPATPTHPVEGVEGPGVEELAVPPEGGSSSPATKSLPRSPVAATGSGLASARSPSTVSDGGEAKDYGPDMNAVDAALASRDLRYVESPPLSPHLHGDATLAAVGCDRCLAALTLCCAHVQQRHSCICLYVYDR